MALATLETIHLAAMANNGWAFWFFQGEPEAPKELTEAELKAIEDEKIRADEERIRIEAERIRLEREEKKRNEEEERKAEEERQRIEQARLQVIIEVSNRTPQSLVTPTEAIH